MSEEATTVGKKRPGRLFFTDLDETLLTSEKKVSAETYEALTCERFRTIKNSIQYRCCSTC